MTPVTKENFAGQKYDVFERFSRQMAVVSAGKPGDFNSMTIGWGAMGNLWGHPGSAITIYVSPDRYTWSFLEKNDFFTVCFFPEQYRDDVMTLGKLSGRDTDKIARTKLTPVGDDRAVWFEQAELTFVCRKVYSHQFDAAKVPEQAQRLYQRLTPHYEYIGFIEDVFGQI